MQSPSDPMPAQATNPPSTPTPSTIERQRLAGLQRMMQHRRIILLTDGFSTPFLAKTAIGLLRYRTEHVAAVLDQEHAGKRAQDLLGAGGDIPVVGSLNDIDGADAIYVGIAPPGGKFPPAWREIVLQGLDRQMDIVSGLHEFLIDEPCYVERAATTKASLIDVRRNQFKNTASGHGFRDKCVRIHTVGHDCSIGKMVTSLELVRAMTAAGHDAHFLATGQTGIMVSGDGIPIDCVVADFVNGAAESLVQAHDSHDFVVIEGQGSISHPAFSAVTAGLLHGCAPHGLIFGYEAGRTHVKGLDGIAIPDLDAQVNLCLAMANIRQPCKLIGFAINTRTLSAEEADREIQMIEQEFSLPACDVIRHGADKLVQASLKLRRELNPSCD